MSHSMWCPSEDEARDEARRAARFDAEYGFSRRYGSPYDDCEEADSVYRYSYNSEWHRQQELLEEQEYQRRMEIQQQEQLYWAEQERQEAAYLEECERGYWEREFECRFMTRAVRWFMESPLLSR